ncbi:MAG: M81 family metallopeptidase [Albidovulum sp.]|nr:M81 family metallopeptidase [Albidovulum sp.]
MKRVLLAGLFHETHCFVDETTPIEAFTVARGRELLNYSGNGSTIDGFLEVADRKRWHVIPVCAYAATPSGLVEDGVVNSFWRELEEASATAHCDAVFLSLHGAMVSQSLEDVEGTLLKRLRALPGMSSIPVFGVFDLHANMTAAMAEFADCLVCYRKNPHTDAREMAVFAAELLDRCLFTQTRPRMAVRHAGIVWPPTGTGTDEAPMRDLESAARRLEKLNPDFWAVNVVAGFSFGDCRESGVAFSVVADNLGPRVDAALEELCARSWEMRSTGLPSELEPNVALARIAESALDGPALLVEPSDNIGGGAPGDGTAVLRAFIEAGQKNCAVILNDPDAVAVLQQLSPGDEIRLSIGGRQSPVGAGPIALDVELLSTSDGRFTLEDIRSHMVASTGREIAMGPCAVARHKDITLLLTSRKTAPFDLGQWRSQGLEPRQFAVIGVKAAVAHRRAYDPIAAASFTVSTPGACTSDPRRLPYRRLRRPTYPLDSS